MSKIDSKPAQFPANPYYGKGIYRRRIVLTRQGNRVEARLEDTNHGFSLTLDHDGQHISKVDGQALRYPLSTCPQAMTRLQDFIGLPVAMTEQDFRRRIPARQNCTHWYDLLVLSIRHSQREQAQRDIEIAVTDPEDGVSACKVWIDGDLTIDWQCRKWVIEQPAQYRGISLFSGFSAWAFEQLSGDVLEAALALQKGYLVAQSLRYDLNVTGGRPIKDMQSPSGVCYSYTAGVFEKAIIQKGYCKDFTHQRDKLTLFTL